VLESAPQFFIGIDGGGTGCRARLTDREGHLLGSGSAAPAAVRFGIDQALAALRSAANAALAEAGLSADVVGQTSAVAGLAGIGRKGVLEELNARSQPFHSIQYVNDATIACIGAHEGGNGGIVIIGTGSVGLAVLEGKEVRVGGYGFPISDEGSGADLGLRAIRFSLRAQDGRIATSQLTKDVMAQFGDDPFAAVAWADRSTATDYAKLAPLIMDHAENGDAVARHIVMLAAQELDRLARRLMEFGTQRIALLGGLAPRMASWLATDVRERLVTRKGDAIDGALHLARCTARRIHNETVRQ
jgi:glucosamine kinase